MDLRTEPIIRLTDEARRPTRWWVAWIVAVVLIVALGGVGYAVGNAVLGSPKESEVAAQYLELFSFGFTAIGLALWVVLKEGRPVSSLGFRGGLRRGLGTLLVGFVIGAALMAVGVLAGTVLGWYDTGTSSHSVSGPSALVGLVPLLLVFVFQGSTEEAVTRGFMFQWSGRQLPAWVAILGTTAFFAVVHVDFHPIILLNIALYALFATFLVLQQGSLWLVCGIHAGWNYAQGNLFGLPVSGHEYATSLWSFGPAAETGDALTGGDFGLEASILGTVILAVATAVAYRAWQRARVAPLATTAR
ncbi:CPBP family intramembrane glutamic endopeptidase [Mumia sp. DW29H23]|uniref:CPBP family intramembrane glutamic endopeptidase n=1 Tax=Mumia sp. DW29H23 TaxID=3421241 RepID=UPI003D68B1DD